MSEAFAARPTRGPVICYYNSAKDILKQECCQTQTDSKGTVTTWCTKCDTGIPSNCGPRYPGRDVSNLNVVPPAQLSPNAGSVKPPPETTTICPDGSTTDANGNCLPNKNLNSDNSRGQQLANNNNDNNNPPADNRLKSKGNGLPGQLGSGSGGGDSTSATKRNNNNNSPSPPACPTDNSPIPPDCTLKPKF